MENQSGRQCPRQVKAGDDAPGEPSLFQVGCSGCTWRALSSSLRLRLVFGSGASPWGCSKSTLPLVVLLVSSVVEDDSWNTADLPFSSDSSDWSGKAHPSVQQSLTLGCGGQCRLSLGPVTHHVRWLLSWLSCESGQHHEPRACVSL